ncbi:TetR family transcriptional regulator [Mycolicibacterium duvalii]|uniref:TetR family transcriptional regulator n=1 Tax=Mycolicibacterium duvalii TaxID=39688 RepID=A0A7I7K8A6_9MYCO|nr:TetR family transcriptional regulator [Mycolicibacterium duvalii]MCV7366478.1 TetR family transcriptional regulator [Mycolicibacterium duvalii]PEG43738.1 TetR family transcriptional regulator [Mycolicibacterium duvalii]BBX20305.1 TetR family transcriptional regulator [Mycolicibacterium duvalii]
MVDMRGERALGLRERKKRKTRATLINAAVGLCDSQGFDATTVDQIAAVADVSSRTFSRYFATKEAIALALIDEILDMAAAELARQPLDLGPYEASRRAWVGMAHVTTRAGADGLGAERLLQILRIVMTSTTLRQAVVEYRADVVDVVLARRMGVAPGDRRVRLISSVWCAVLMTALESAVDDAKSLVSITVDDLVAAFEATYAEFASEMAGIGQPV